MCEAYAKMAIRDVLPEDLDAVIELLDRSMHDVGFDAETGKIDMDRILSGNSNSKRNKIQMILDKISEIQVPIQNKIYPLKIFGNRWPVKEELRKNLCGKPSRPGLKKGRYLCPNLMNIVPWKQKGKRKIRKRKRKAKNRRKSPRNNVSETNAVRESRVCCSNSLSNITQFRCHGIQDFYPPQWKAIQKGLQHRNLVVSIPNSWGRH